FALDYEIMYATQLTLYHYLPNTNTTLTPNLASGMPIVTNGGKTITVHIKPNVHFSPPVNRAVTSADIAYAIERGANPNVLNPYFQPYFGDIVGAAKATGGPIAGIQTPNATKPTQYGTSYEVFTGPYMLKSDATGKFGGIGYQPGKSATLVRNPNWNSSGDPRPAYLDGVNINIGGDTNVIGRQVLTGTHVLQNDTPAGPIVKLAYQQYYN